MTDFITVEEIELLRFFGVEPEKLDPEETWPHTDFLYETSRGDMRVSCSISPVHKDVRIILRHGTDIIYELNALDVSDIRYRETKDRDVLEIIVNQREKILLWVDPQIRMLQEVKQKT